MPGTVTIGTRPSVMALAQVDRLSRELKQVTGGSVEITVHPHASHGDRWAGPLHLAGGKGAFTRELDALLLAKTVDVVIHCAKDIPGDQPLPAGTVIAAVPTRDDRRDALVHPAGLTLAQLPAGARIGTSSVRRMAQLALHWPHLRPVPIRGNADTRLSKMDEGWVDAVLLGCAGLQRIAQDHRITELISEELMLPAIGAGALVCLTREDDLATRTLFAKLDDALAHRELDAERALLNALQGTCHTPIAGTCTTEAGVLLLKARVISPDASTVLDVCERGADSSSLGASVAAMMLAKGAGRLLGHDESQA